MNKKYVSKAIGVAILFVMIFTSFSMVSSVNASAKQSTYSDVIKAFQEVAYAYYMRGKNIQYNVPKAGYWVLSPEGATRQRTTYAHCCWYLFNVYR